MIAHPDKQRFVDLEDTDSLVCSVELSNQRSVNQFVTLFLKGRTLESDVWCEATGLRKDNHHDPAIYHRGDRIQTWMKDYFPENYPGWTFHYHVRLDHAPELDDLLPYREGLSNALWGQLQGYFQAAAWITA